ncbi:MAG: PorT family protein [Bacteroidales bacterium]|nr:PorT family protein [Bacteroidales bacterium]
MKKKIFYLLLMFFTGATFSVNAQIVRGALIGGVNLSQVDGDEIYGFRQVGANVGGAAIIPFTEHWTLTLETIYSMEGAKQKAKNLGIWEHSYYDSIWINPYNDVDSFYLNGAYNLRLNYVRIPIVAHYVDKKFSLGGGVEYGRLVNVKEQEHDIYNTDFIADSAYNKNDLSILADVKFQIYKGIYLNVRYSYSLLKIRERTFRDVYNLRKTTNRKQYNNILTLRLIWVINDKGKTLQRQSKEVLPY